MNSSLKMLRVAAAVAVSVIALLATSAPAHADATTRFMALSGDNCRYGATQGTLTWVYSPTTPTRVVTVQVRGNLVDNPLPNQWGFLCRDDAFFSVASFTAYLTNGSVATGAVRANNEIVDVSLTLGSSTTTAGISRVAVQVCRHPLPVTPPLLAPSYCGTAQHYGPPPRV